MKTFLTILNNSSFSNFSAGDKRQVVTLLILIAVIVATNFFVKFCDLGSSDKNLLADSTAQAKLTMLSERYAKIQDEDTLNRLDLYITRRYDTLNLFKFDPNTVGFDELKQLGLSDKQANNLMRYRNNGGIFREPDDFRKLYGIRTLQFKFLKPFIEIASKYQNAKIERNFQEKNLDSNIDNLVNLSPQENKEPATKTQKLRFDFDPNTITKEQMCQLGFTDRQAESFINFRNKGKKFYCPKDFLSAYCVDNQTYNELEKYIKIDLDALFDGKHLTDLNTADKEELMACGLSETEARAVIEFRSEVGYYFANWQISDVLTYQRANELKSKFYVCASVEIQKIDLNTATLQVLENHPYIDKKANSIIALREKSPIKNPDEIKNIVGDKTFKKLKNYLK